MSYFVTGGTGFIGRHLVERLLEREGDVHVLVRAGSRDKLDALVEALLVVAELGQPGQPPLVPRRPPLEAFRRQVAQPVVVAVDPVERGEHRVLLDVLGQPLVHQPADDDHGTRACYT